MSRESVRGHLEAAFLCHLNLMATSDNWLVIMLIQKMKSLSLLPLFNFDLNLTFLSCLNCLRFVTYG